MEYLPHQFGPALQRCFREEIIPWIGDGHADLVDLVGMEAIRRTTIDTGRLVNNWQTWIGESTIASKIDEVKTWGPGPARAILQVDAVADEIRAHANSGYIEEKSLILNNAPYVLVEEEKRGKFMALGAIDHAETKWGEVNGP